MSRVTMPRVGRRTLHVWRRDASVYGKTWKISFIPPLFEPLLYLLAFGAGLAPLVGNIRYGGGEIPYLDFIAPALIAVSIMNNAFFETTFASFVRMFYQKTFDAMLATPLTLDEIITGEIIWGSTKAAIATVLMMAVLAPFGLLSYPAALLLLPLAFLGGVAFGAAGMICTGLAPHIDTFNLPVFLFITPMFLLSGTFFPLENLPTWAGTAARALPLTHLTALARAAGLGRYSAGLPWSVAYLVVWTAICYPIALRGMRRRLIK